MGADIYLNSVHDKNCKKYETQFNRAVQLRGQASSVVSHEQHQFMVDKYHNLMNSSDGYFRDSYNNSSLFWMYKMSWWDISEELCDNNSYLSIVNAKVLMHRIIEIKHDHAMNAWLEQQHNKPSSTTTEWEWRTYFAKKREDILTLLRSSIRLNEPLVFSV